MVATSLRIQNRNGKPDPVFVSKTEIPKSILKSRNLLQHKVMSELTSKEKREGITLDIHGTVFSFILLGF